jgi:hypothetical protein
MLLALAGVRLVYSSVLVWASQSEQAANST